MKYEDEIAFNEFMVDDAPQQWENLKNIWAAALAYSRENAKESVVTPEIPVELVEFLWHEVERMQFGFGAYIPEVQAMSEKIMKWAELLDEIKSSRDK